MKNIHLIAIASAMVLSSCASIVSKSNWPVSIQSDPSGVPFTVTNKDGLIVSSGSTPTSLLLPSGAGYFRGERYTIEYNKDGRVVKQQINTELNGWYFGNILFPIGFFIDPATGAMFRLPDTVSQKI